MFVLRSPAFLGVFIVPPNPTILHLLLAKGSCVVVLVASGLGLIVSLQFYDFRRHGGRSVGCCSMVRGRSTILDSVWAQSSGERRHGGL
jgi:hypothetical protein